MEYTAADIKMIPSHTMQNTQPQYLQHPAQAEGSFQYVNKFKSALYASILFVLLSHKVAYKVLDLIIKVFVSSIDVIDENENPQILGTIIMALVIGFVIFIL
jgi:hypothetical protein